MTGLAAWAAEQHATTGLLMASVSGRKLYDSLGWSTVAPIVTLRGEDDSRGEPHEARPSFRRTARPGA